MAHRLHRKAPMDAAEPSKPLLAELRTSPATFALLALNLAVFAFTWLTGGLSDPERAVACGAAERSLVWAGGVHRLLTALFLHAGAWHLLGNLGAILFWGLLLERARSSAWMLLVFFLSGVAGFVAGLDRTDALHYGASSAACGMAAAFTLLICREGGGTGTLIYGPAFGFALLLTVAVPVGSKDVSLLGHVVGAGAGALLAALFPPDPRHPRVLRAARLASLVLAVAVLAGTIASPDNKKAALPGILVLREARRRCDAEDPTAVLRLAARAQGLGADPEGVAIERARAACMLDAPAVALQELDAAIHGVPPRARLFHERARIREMTGDLRGALEDYERALHLDPRPCCESGRGRVRSALARAEGRNS